MLKMFPVDVPSHNIVECVPERAFFAKVHCFLHTISLSDPIKKHFIVPSQCSSLRVPIILPCWTGYVEYFNMRLQSSLACSECAVWTVKQNFTIKDFPVYIAEVILVARVVFGRKWALCAAKWLRSVFLKDIMENNGIRTNMVMCISIWKGLGHRSKIYLCFRVWWIPSTDIKAKTALYKLLIRTKLFELLWKDLKRLKCICYNIQNVLVYIKLLIFACNIL